MPLLPTDFPIEFMRELEAAIRRNITAIDVHSLCRIAWALGWAAEADSALFKLIAKVCCPQLLQFAADELAEFIWFFFSFVGLAHWRRFGRWWRHELVALGASPMAI